MIGFLFLSILTAICISLILVEKSTDWPVKNINIKLKYFIHEYIYWKMTPVLDCAVCTSFWMAIVTDIYFYFYTHGLYFMWPISGFIASGITFMLYRFFSR